MPIGSKLIDDDSELEWRLFFSSRTKPRLFTQSYSISLLWNVENIFKRGFEFRDTGIVNMCLFYEDHFVLGDSEQSGRRILVSFKFTDLFLGVF